MKKIALVVDKFYGQNKIFDENDTAVNRDDCMRPYIDLKSRLASVGVELVTQDIYNLKEYYAFIFINIPNEDDAYYTQVRQTNAIKYCIITELIYIHKNNLRTDRYGEFEKIFTYQDDLINNKNILKLNYSFTIPKLQAFDNSARNKFITLIAGNKGFKFPGELYSERKKAIRWYEKHHPEMFDLYGVGWENTGAPNSGMRRRDRILSWFNPAKKNGPYPSYRGKIKLKNEVLSRYRFSLVYENACSVKGWITEKPFDCFFSGCVPVYWGPDNAGDFIPAECYIDKRHFGSYGKLHKYLTRMSDEKYAAYQDAILRFLRGDQIKIFGIEYFSGTLIENLMSEKR